MTRIELLTTLHELQAKTDVAEFNILCRNYYDGDWHITVEVQHDIFHDKSMHVISSDDRDYEVECELKEIRNEIQGKEEE